MEASGRKFYQSIFHYPIWRRETETFLPIYPSPAFLSQLWGQRKNLKKKKKLVESQPTPSTKGQLTLLLISIQCVLFCFWLLLFNFRFVRFILIILWIFILPILSFCVMVNLSFLLLNSILSCELKKISSTLIGYVG